MCSNAATARNRPQKQAYRTIPPAPNRRHRPSAAREKKLNFFLGRLSEERLQTNLRPRFERFLVAQEFTDRSEARIENLVFARLYRRAFDIEDMHHA